MIIIQKLEILLNKKLKVDREGKRNCLLENKRSSGLRF